MYPMDFEEYLWAKGKKVLVDEIRHSYETNQALVETLHTGALQEYYSDTGIMSARAQMNQERLLSTEAERFRGIFAENYVACALKTNGYELMYWESDGKAEVDFLIVKDNHVIPVECKARDYVKAKSLGIYREKYHPLYSIRISTRNFGMADEIKSVPLYAAFCI